MKVAGKTNTLDQLASLVIQIFQVCYFIEADQIGKFWKIRLG